MGANSRYTVAVHALLLLEDPGGGWTASDWIAGSVNTNPVVIRRVLAALQDAGLVEGQKGPRGGYRLRRPSREISLWEVYEAMREDGPFLMHASAPNPKCPIGGRIQKHLRGIYDATEASMQRVLGKTSVAALRRQVQGEC
jgi:Rrf2 family protein